MKTLEILTANQMKSGDLTISIAITQDVDILTNKSHQGTGFKYLVGLFGGDRKT